MTYSIHVNEPETETHSPAQSGQAPVLKVCALIMRDLLLLLLLLWAMELELCFTCFFLCQLSSCMRARCLVKRVTRYARSLANRVTPTTSLASLYIVYT